MKIETRGVVFPSVVMCIAAWIATAVLLGGFPPQSDAASASAGFLVGMCVLLTAFTVFVSFADREDPL